MRDDLKPQRLNQEPVGLDHWGAAILGRSKGVIEDEEIRQDPENERVYWVKGSGGNEYRTQVLQDEGTVYVICNCPNGLKKSLPTCYHSGATALVTNGHTKGDFR